MRAQELAKNLSVSLANCVWDAKMLEAALVRRLPAFSNEASGLAEGLIQDFPQCYAPSSSQIADMLRSGSAFRKLYNACRKRGTWPDPVIEPPRMLPTAAFTNTTLPQLATPSDLADWMQVSSDALVRFADLYGLHNHDDEAAANHYFWRIHPKSRGGVRLIEAPKPALKSLQRLILRQILDQVPVHENSFGFVPGKSCLQGAQRHCGEELVISMDIKDFFPSVRAARVHALFRCLGYPHAVAQALTGICTLTTPARVLDRLPVELRPRFRSCHLPQGAPSSPALANLCCFRLDCRLNGLARRLGAQYSRYADDITFSGDSCIRQIVLHAVPDILAEEGYVLHTGKTRVQRQGTRQVVTGLVVNERVSVGRVGYDQLKAVLHRCSKPGDTRLHAPAFQAELSGKIAWFEQVNPAKGMKLREKFEAAVSAQ